METVDTVGVSGTSPRATPTRGLSDRWWAFALRGLAGIAFGVLCWILPGIGLLTLVYMFGFWALVEGVGAIAAATRSEATERPWWMLALQGMVGLAAGLLAILIPGITAFALLMLIATWAVVGGVLQVVTAIRLRTEIRGEWMLALGGIVSVIFGGLLVLFPGLGALAVVVWIGGFAFFFGALLVVLGVRMRNELRGRTPKQQQPRSRGAYAASH